MVLQYTTGCYTVSVTSDTPLIFAIHGRIRISFDVVNEQWLRFDFLKKKKIFLAKLFFYGCVRQKRIFAVFGPGSQVPRLTDSAADCSAPCGPIWLKFYVVNGLGYGYG